jgi:hypothetical protein
MLMYAMGPNKSMCSISNGLVVVMIFLHDDGLRLAFWLGKLRKVYLSQKQYWLIKKCDHFLEFVKVPHTNMG